MHSLPALRGAPECTVVACDCVTLCVYMSDVAEAGWVRCARVIQCTHDIWDKWMLVKISENK